MTDRTIHDTRAEKPKAEKTTTRQTINPGDKFPGPDRKWHAYLNCGLPEAACNGTINMPKMRSRVR